MWLLRLNWLTVRSLQVVGTLMISGYEVVLSVVVGTVVVRSLFVGSGLAETLVWMLILKFGLD